MVTSFLNDNPTKILRDDEDYTISIHGKLPSRPVQLPDDIVGILATTSDHKEEDWDRIVRNHALRIYLINAFVKPEDSRETENNPVDITIGKLNVSIRGGFEQISAAEKEKTLKTAKGDKDTLFLEIAEDRFTNIDPRFKNWEGFQKFKDHELIKDCFEEGADFPGHRIKELMDALGGPLVFLEELKKATKALPKQDPVTYANLSTEREVGVCVAIRSLDPNACPELAEGVVIKVAEKNAHFTFPSEETIAKIKAEGREKDIALDDFDHPSTENHAIAQLRTDLKNPYFDEKSCYAIAWQTFLEHFTIPELAAPRPLKQEIRYPNPTILLNAPLPRKIRSKFARSIMGTPTLLEQRNPIGSLQALENSGMKSHAIALIDNLEPRIKERGRLKNPALEANIRKWELLLQFGYAATLKGLHHPFFAGEPILYEKSLEGFFAPMMTSLQTSKAISAKPSKTAAPISTINRRQIDRNLVWQSKYFTPPEKQLRTTFNPLAAGDILAHTGLSREKLGYTFGMVGGASLGLVEGLEAGNLISYKGAINGMSIVDGGGTRPGSMMGTMPSGFVQALKEGKEIKGHHLGIRALLPSSREGSIKDFMTRTSFDFTQGDENSFYQQINHIFHVFNCLEFADRQHAIAGIADSLAVLPGGWGTIVEIAINALDNLYQQRENPTSLLPGFNRKVRPVHIANVHINGDPEKRYYNFLHQMFSPEELEAAHIHFHNDGQGVFNALQQHRAELNAA